MYEYIIELCIDNNSAFVFNRADLVGYFVVLCVSDSNSKTKTVDLNLILFRKSVENAPGNESEILLGGLSF